MRIALVTGEYPPMRGGVADYTAIIGDNLAKLGVDVTVLTSRRADDGRDGAVRVDPSVATWSWRCWSDLARHARQFRPDLIHVQYQTGAFDLQIGINLWPWLGQFRRMPPVVVTFHDLKEPYILPKLGRLRHIATHLLAAGAGAVIATNHEDYGRLSGGFATGRTSRAWGSRPLAAIPIGSNIPVEPADPRRTRDWRRRLGAAADELVIGYFGFLGPTKGGADLVEAFQSSLRAGVNARLAMVGASRGDSETAFAGEEGAIRARLAEPTLADRVTWTGYLPAREVGYALQALDLICLPFTEGGSLRHGTLVAALTHGVPTVTTRPSESRELSGLPILRDGVSALLVSPRNPRALGEAIRRAAADPRLRATLAQGAAEIADCFSWESIARQSLALYRNVLTKERSGT